MENPGYSGLQPRTTGVPLMLHDDCDTPVILIFTYVRRLLFSIRHTFIKPLHALSAGLLHFFRHVTIHIQGERSCRMAQIILDGLNVIADLDGRYGVSMPEVVKTSLGQAELSDDSLEPFKTVL